jgi:hypothetical protein
VAAAGHAVAALAADEVALAADQVSDGDVLDAVGHLDHVPGELMSHDERKRQRLPRPVIKFPDMQVCAAYAGA